MTIGDPCFRIKTNGDCSLYDTSLFNLYAAHPVSGIWG